MRVIAGLLKGRIIPSSKLTGARPTTDRARETIFNILQNRLDFENISVLDICAGSGALGFESVSRGAESCVFIEKNARNSAEIKKIAEQFGVIENCQVLNLDALTALKFLADESVCSSFDIIFADPPYALKLINPIFSDIQKYKLANKSGIFVAEHDRRESILIPTGWQKISERLFGETMIEFFEKM